METRIIIVEDDPDYLELLNGKLSAAGFLNIRTEDDSVKAASRFQKGAVFDIALIDMNMPGMDGIALLEFIKNTSPRTECIMVTAVNDARIAVECLKKGAYDYLVKPITQEDLVFSITRSLERKRLLDILNIKEGKSVPRLKNPEPFRQILTRSETMRRLLKEAELHAASEVPVLITGESGTGKELLARAIHRASLRARNPFTPVNMASQSATLFEAEFFGHTKGAFTGAEKDRSGFLMASNHGTLFLDEIGNLPLELQGKLLRVLQDGEYTRLGTSKRQKVDVRIIAATNEDLDDLLSRKKFRKDLYYRIRGGWLHLPPLRERREDIPILVDHFLESFCSAGKRCKMTDESCCLMLEYPFPGNIRELEAIVQSAVNLAQGRPIAPEFLPKDLLQNSKTAVCAPPESISIRPLADIEREHILNTYTHTGQNKSKTARMLGIGLNTLRRKLRAYGADTKG